MDTNSWNSIVMPNVDKDAGAVMNKTRVVRHLMKGNTIFFFLRVDVTNSAKVTINGKAATKGTEIGMEAPCTKHSLALSQC